MDGNDTPQWACGQRSRRGLVWGDGACTFNAPRGYGAQRPIALAKFEFRLPLVPAATSG